jgi:hypothetical protein
MTYSSRPASPVLARWRTFVTQYDSLEMARATAEAGARGYIAKVHIPTDLVPAIVASVDFPPAEAKPYGSPRPGVSFYASIISF